MNGLRRYSSLPQRAYDVMIVGGGLIGSTMACALGKNPLFADLKIGLIEAAPKRVYKCPEIHSNRVSSINPKTKNLLSELKIWQHIHRSCPVKNMIVWGSYSHNSTNFVGSEGEILADIVENDEIIYAVTEELMKLKNVEVLYNAKIRSINLSKREENRSPEIVLDDNQSYSCKLLIGADGPSSKVREAMSVNRLSWNYNQCGVVATLEILAENGNNTAWQRFLPDGPVALLPLNEKYSSLVWSTTPENAKMLLQIPNDAFIDAVNEAIMKEPIKNTALESFKPLTDILNNILPTAQNCDKSLMPKVYNVVESSRASFPLGFSHSAEYVSKGAVIVGDAAHRVHPLAGQGVNLGFRDVDTLNQILSKGLSEGRILGDLKDLRNYEGLSQKSNVPLMAAIDFLYHVYTSNKTIVQTFGDLGFKIADIPAVKNLMKMMASK